MKNSKYKNSFEHIQDELLRLDLLIQSKFNDFTEKTHNDLKGLVITPEEITSILDKKTPKNPKENTEIQKVERKILQKASLAKEYPLTLVRLAELFNLDKFEINAIIICLAPEIDTKYEKLYAYLNDDVSQKKPSVNLIIDLICKTTEEKVLARNYFQKHSKLFRLDILQYEEEQEKNHLLSRLVKLDQRIVNFLLENNAVDPSIEAFAWKYSPQFYHDVPKDVENLFDEQLKYAIENPAKFQKSYFNFYGADEENKITTSYLLCKKYDIKLLVVNISQIINKNLDLVDSITKALRESLLSRHAVYFENFDQLFEKGEQSEWISRDLKSVLSELSYMVFFGTKSIWNPGSLADDSLFCNVEFSLPSYPARKKLWDTFGDNIAKLGVEFEKNVDFEILSNKFHFSTEQIFKALVFAKNLSQGRNPSKPIISMQDLEDACKATSNQNLTKLAKKLSPTNTWNDIILPQKTISLLQDICNRTKNKEFVYHKWGFGKKFTTGKGIVTLFKGESGTGKTMAAEIIANELQLDIYKIDLSAIVSKYIGETEKNLNKIFAEAETSNAILFFDEADALFGKRSEVKDAHDRYANVETNYLLQKIEEYDGIVLLATNFQKNIDDAFTRRMHFIIDFPFPDAKHRLAIWQNVFPKEAPLINEVDLKYLSSTIRLSGGSIKNIAFNSAFMAAANSKKITMKDLIVAIKQEYEKMGKPITKGEFGKYANFLEE